MAQVTRARTGILNLEQYARDLPQIVAEVLFRELGLGCGFSPCYHRSIPGYSSVGCIPGRKPIRIKNGIHNQYVGRLLQERSDHSQTPVSQYTIPARGPESLTSSREKAANMVDYSELFTKFAKHLSLLGSK